MGCEFFELPGGGRAIICSRGGGKPRAPRSACGKRVHARLCDFPLPGKKRGRTCSAKLCDACTQRVAGELDLCPTHARIMREAQVPSSLLEQRDPFALQVAADQAAAAGFVTRARFKPRDVDDWQEFVTERAAIAEYLGGLTREAAEQLARELAGPAPGRYRSAGPLFAGAR